MQKPIVLYDATEFHPAQTQLVTQDETVGHWHTVKHSGAVPAPRRKLLLERAEKLLQAVKFAREQANNSDVEQKKIGSKVMNYLLGS